MKTEKGFTSKYMSLINPNDSQKTEVETLLAEYAKKNSNLVASFTDSLNKLKLELQSKLEPKLTIVQKEKIKQSRISNPVEIKQKTKLEQKPFVKELMKDSVSKMYIDSLKSRRKELKKEKIIEKIEKRVDEKSLILKKELNLTESQSITFDKVIKEFTAKFIAIRQDTISAQDVKKEQIKALRKNLILQLRSILNPEQLEKFKEMGKEMWRERSGK
jgi:hypothetical protein